MNIKDRLIIALDYSNMEDAKNIVEILEKQFLFIK